MPDRSDAYTPNAPPNKLVPARTPSSECYWSVSLLLSLVLFSARLSSPRTVPAVANPAAATVATFFATRFTLQGVLDPPRFFEPGRDFDLLIPPSALLTFLRLTPTRASPRSGGHESGRARASSLTRKPGERTISRPIRQHGPLRRPAYASDAR